MPQTATHKLPGKRRKRRRRAQSCHLSVWAPTTKPSTLRMYPSLTMMVVSPPNVLAGVSRKARPPHAWKRTWSSRQPFILSSRRARRRRPSDPSLRNRLTTTISTLMMRTRKQRSSRAAAVCLALRCSLNRTTTSSRKRSTKMRSWTSVALRSLATLAKDLTPSPRGSRLS